MFFFFFSLLYAGKFVKINHQSQTAPSDHASAANLGKILRNKVTAYVDYFHSSNICHILLFAFGKLARFSALLYVSVTVAFYSFKIL